MPSPGQTTAIPKKETNTPTAATLPTYHQPLKTKLLVAALHLVHQIAVHLQWAISLTLLAAGLNSLATHTSCRLACVGVHTAAVTLKLAIFANKHLHPKTRHHQGHYQNGTQQRYQQRFIHIKPFIYNKSRISMRLFFLAPQAGLEPATP